MLNLSQLSRERPLSLTTRIRLLLSPDYFLAENVADYNQNAVRAEIPWYKHFHSYFPLSPLDFLFYVIINDVGVTQIPSEPPTLFCLHDDSGVRLISWDDKRTYRAQQSSDQFRQEHGINDNHFGFGWTVLSAFTSEVGDQGVNSHLLDITRERLQLPRKSSHYSLASVREVFGYIPDFLPAGSR